MIKPPSIWRFATPLLALLLIVQGCASTEENEDLTDTGQVHDTSSSNDTDNTEDNDSGDPADSESLEDTSPDDTDSGAPGEMPQTITTKTATYTGSLTSTQIKSFTLQATQGDTVVMYLRRADAQQWHPAISIERATTTIVYSDPKADIDAHIPYKPADLASGFDFRNDGPYQLLLKNRSEFDGEYIFSVECLSGPCKDGPTDPVDPVDPVDPTDPTDPDYPNFGTLKDDALRQAIRANHRHKSLGYSQARVEMFSTIDNKDGQVECIYTGTKVTTSGIPANATMNTEHTWPQSRGAKSEPQKSDLHHLFPSMSTVNSRRSNHEFGVVVNATWSEKGSKLGKGIDGQTRFEPRDASKGNIARAIMYFSVIYNKPIGEVEEAAVRAWHIADPVTDEDRARNDAIEAVQRSRNPFIDNPGLVSRIADF